MTYWFEGGETLREFMERVEPGELVEVRLASGARFQLRRPAKVIRMEGKHERRRG